MLRERRTANFMSNKTIVIFPTQAEAQPFIDKFGDKCAVEVCGIGLVECAAKTSAIIAGQRPSLMILAGVAGAYVNSGIQKGECVGIIRENNADMGSLRGDTFVPLPQSDSVVLESEFGRSTVDNYYLCDFDYPENIKRVASNSMNCSATNEKNIKFSSTQVENMEGAAFFNVCIAHGVRFAELRAISNFVGEEKSGWIVPKASEILAEFVYTFLINMGIVSKE